VRYCHRARPPLLDLVVARHDRAPEVDPRLGRGRILSAPVVADLVVHPGGGRIPGTRRVVVDQLRVPRRAGGGPSSDRRDGRPSSRTCASPAPSEAGRSSRPRAGSEIPVAICPNTQPRRVLRPGFHRAAAAASPPQRRRQRHGADHAVMRTWDAKRSTGRAGEPDVGQPLVDAPGTVRSLSAASARDPLAAARPPGIRCTPCPTAGPPARRRTSWPRSRPAAGVDVVVLKNGRSLPGGS
jgi:hypothetical protein